MARKLKSDKLLFTATLLLVGASVVMVYSASAVIAMERYHQPTMFLFKQATWALLGLALMPIVMRIDYRQYRQPAVIWTALGVVGFALVAVLFGPRINGARRWFGFAGIGVQPSELAKLPVIVFIAAILERRMDRIEDIKYALLPIGARRRRRRGAGPPRARPRHGAVDPADLRGDGVRRRHPLPVPDRPVPPVAASGLRRAHERRATGAAASPCSSTRGRIRSATGSR